MGRKGKKMLFSITFLIFLFLSSSSNFQLEGQLQVGGNCSGEKMGECPTVVEEEESMEMDSEMNRRSLWAATTTRKRYISYEALRGDNVPCTRPGIPYYNCHALPKANPYTRGCSVITGCARGG